MLLTNRLNFFDKKGNEINLLPQVGTRVTVVDPTNSGGYGATFNVYTNPDGNIAALEIANGGYNYDITGNAYLRFENLLTGYVWDSNPADLVVDPLTGTIIGFNGLSFTGNSDWKPGNETFAYPNVTWLGEMYFDMVSTGLIENQDIFVLEQVVATPQTPFNQLNYGYSFPRAEEGPANAVSFYSNDVANSAITSSTGVGSVTVYIESVTGNFFAGEGKIFSMSSTANLKAGMIIEGTGIPAGTKIVSVDSATQITIDSLPTQNGMSIALESYVPHGFIAGMSIRVYDNSLSLPIAGTYEVVQVSDRKVYFSTTSAIPTIGSTAAAATTFFSAAPKWRGRMVGLEEEIFMFTVKYEEEFPVITKVQSFVHDPINASELTSPDSFTAGLTGDPAVGNFIDASVPGYQFRQVFENWEERLMHFHLGFSAGTEGSYIRVFVLEDITFPYAPRLISQISLRGEAQGEDERLQKLLENFGRSVTENQELILRDSDVFEDLPNYLLLNEKRKEMLLQGDQIWPYLGSYKGLVNIINWFGYYDIRIKEYWLNVNKNDAYYGKYKQIQIPFQLEARGVPYGIEMMPSKVYKKTNKFGLFYDLNKESGVLDENGVPQTVDAFQFSNQEVLIKLFALKQYLEGSFIPLNAKIVDIVGEGVYFERYAANTWNDRVEQFVVELTRNVDFVVNDTRLPIEDARRYDTNEVAYSYSPGTDTLKSYFATYTIKGVNMTLPLATVNRIPTLTVGSTSGNASPSKLWNGVAYVKGSPNNYFLSANSDGGINYTVGDIVTLGGGVFSTPIRVRVGAIAPGGVVTSVQILTGLTQGSRYYSLPQKFSQTYVASSDYVNNFYYSGIGQGLKLDAGDIQYELEGVTTTTQGKGYPILDPPVFIVTDPLTGSTIPSSYNFNLSTVQGPYVGYFDEGKQLEALTNEPNAPVAAFLELEAIGFDVTWDEMAFTWENLWGATEATLKAYIDPLPAGTGAIEAIEVVEPGSGYSRTPSVEFIGGDGINATATAFMRDGKVKIIEAEVTSIAVLSPTSSRVFFATPQTASPLQIEILPTMFVTATDTGGNSLEKPCVVITYDTVGGSYMDITTAFNSVPGNFNLQIHAVQITSSGSAYVSNPEVKLVGGQTSTLYTWDEIGRGNFYDMEWLVTSEPGTKNFTYTSGQKSIDELINHTVLLPYKGFYKVEMIVYDTDNNWVNEIKRNFVEVYMPEALSSFATRYIGPSSTPGVSDGSESESNIAQLEKNCVDTWDEAFYMWDEYWGRWINPIKTWTTWDDCDILWDTLNVTPLSQENNWNYPNVPEYEVYRVSAYDNLVGDVSNLTTITPGSTYQLEVELADVQNRPTLNAAIPEWIYIRRGDNIFQVEAVNSGTVTGNTFSVTITTTNPLPDSFLSSPTTWEVLREVANTVVVQDDLYTPENGKTLVPGQFITLKGNNNTPLNDSRWNLAMPPLTWGIPVYAKTVDGVSTLDSGIQIDSEYASNPFMTKEWVNGQIYNFRNQSYENGYLFLSPLPNANTSAVNIQVLESFTEDNWGNRVMFYINNTNTSEYATTADILREVRPGFTEFDLLIVEPDQTFWWWFDPTDTEFPPPLVSPVFPNTSSGAYRPSPTGGPGYIYGVYSSPSTTDAYYIDIEAATQNNVSIPANVKKLWYNRGLDRFYFPEGQGIGNEIYVLDPNTNTSSLFTTLSSPTSSNANMTFVDDVGYNMIYCATTDEFVYCLDAVTGFEIARIDTTPNTSGSGITYDPIRKHVWALAGDNSPLSIIDADPNSSTWNTIIATVTLPDVALGIRYVSQTDTMIAWRSSAATTNYYTIECVAPYTVTTNNIPFTWDTVRGIAYHEADGHWWIGRTNGNIDIFSFFDLSTPVHTISVPTPGLFRFIVYNPVTNSMWVCREVGGVDSVYEVKGLIYDTGTTLYEQHFRTIDAYEDTSNQGTPWSIWSEASSSIYCVEAVSLEGKKYNELETVLQQIDNVTVFGWIEYKYNSFPTRTYSNSSATNLNLVMDFNTRPVLGAFEDSIIFPAEKTGRGWFYDHGISEGEFSQEVVNVGEFMENPGWTVVTVKDPNNELYLCDSTFMEKARDFDEDYADTHLGVKLAWNEVENLDWDAMCSQTWTTLDWPYTLGTNFRIALDPDANTEISLQLNELSASVFDLSAVDANRPALASYMTSLLNNNFYDYLGNTPKNDNPGLSKFNYSLVSRDPTATTVERVFTWGNPTDFNIYGDTTGIQVFSIVHGPGIQPGYTVDSVLPGSVFILPSVAGSNLGSPGPTSYVPWIPTCSFHCSTVANSKALTNIVGYDSNLPIAGYLYDPVAETVIGEFGPGKGVIQESSGFVTYIESDTPMLATEDNRLLYAFPYQSNIVQFIDPAVSSTEDLYYIAASAKSPGTDTLGYLRGDYDLFIQNHYWIDSDLAVGLPYDAFSHTFPLGNYYNWVQDPDIFYGGGLENSLLQFASPYRNIQSYIFNGEEGSREYTAVNGGWYPAITWGTNQTPDGLLFDTPVPGTYPNLYKPWAQVEVVDETGIVIAVNGTALIFNSFFDGQAVLYTAGSPYDLFTNANFAANHSDWNEYPVPVVINVTDPFQAEHILSFNAVVVDPENGIIGRDAVYFNGTTTLDGSLIFDPGVYQITDITQPGVPYFTSSLMPSPIQSLKPGMVLMQLGGGPLTDPYKTRITKVDQENSLIEIDIPQDSSTSGNFVAYTPLDLGLKTNQTVTNSIWSSTKQWDSMRLQYEASMNSAYTWEDTTISYSEKRIPAGSSVLFSSDASNIAGKTKFLWNLYHDGTKVCSIEDPNFLWTFLETGLYDLELQIVDTNGNVQRRYNQDYLEVFKAEH
jgi:hypothetical protein